MSSPLSRDAALSIVVGTLLILGLSVGWMFTLWFVVFMNDITAQPRPPDTRQIVTGYALWLAVQAAIDYFAIRATSCLSNRGSLVFKTMVAVCVIVTVALLLWPMGAWRFVANLWL